MAGDGRALVPDTGKSSYSVWPGPACGAPAGSPRTSHLPESRRVAMKALRVVLMAAAACAVFALPVAADPLASWSTVINGSLRFRVLTGFNNAAVLDKETGDRKSTRLNSSHS